MSKVTGGGWFFSGPKVVTGSQAKLSVGAKGKYSGQLLLLDAPLRIPATDTLHIRLKLDGFSDASGGTETGCSGRFFLAPEPLPKFVEAYSLPNALVLYFDYNGKDAGGVRLCSKVDGKDGYGDGLYEGSVPISSFPLTVDLFVTKDTYRIRFDKDVTSSSGAKSGYHKLPAATWSGDLRFGGRIVNHEELHDSAFTISGIDVDNAAK
jgi:hypothetical protein